MPCGVLPAALPQPLNVMSVRAAGGTIAKVVDDLVQRGASPTFIRVVAVVAAPPALKLLSEKFPGVPSSRAADRRRGLPVPYLQGCSSTNMTNFLHVCGGLEGGRQAVQ